MKRASLSELLILNAYWVGLSFKWNSLHVLILPSVLLHYVPDYLKNTYLGLLTFAGLVVAMLLQPIAGSLSDGWTSRWGRRRPLIAAGTAFDLLFLLALGFAGGLPWLALGYLALQFSSNIAHGAAQGLIPDRVPPEQRGVASGVKNLMDMSGLVVSSLFVGRLLDPDAKYPLLTLGVVAAVVGFAAAITLMGVREQSTYKQINPHAQPRQSGLNLRLDLKNVSTAYWWLIASRFVFLLGIYDIQVFAQYYIRDVLKADNPVKLTGDLLAAITLALIIFALTGGWLGDRIGHKRILVVASIISAAGCLSLLAARTSGLLLVCGSVLGVGIGLFLTSNWALANVLAPGSEAGKYIGLTNFATAGAGAVGRLGGPVIDLLNNTWPGIYAGYSALFLFGAAATLLSALILNKVNPLDKSINVSIKPA